ncbi:MAG: hypothetical protein NC116_12220 [Clostridium sp.]|nr:hypothetical protein [Clostridium sp.]
MRVAKMYVADFETTTSAISHTSTHVWSAAWAEVGDYTDHVEITGSLSNFMKNFVRSKYSSIIYFHNLKFDGSFILSWLESHYYKLAIEDKKMIDKKYMHRGEYTMSISSKGMWYTITVCIGYNKYIEFRDSLKLIPFKLADAAKAFKTRHQKTTMSYDKFHSLDQCGLREIEYIKNDVLVLRELIEYMQGQGHTKLTIGSCCLFEYKQLYGVENYNRDFPNLYKMKTPSFIPEEVVGEFLLRSYSGGWCYKVPCTKEVLYGGFTVDANSLYPSVMHSSSGNRYPIGEPTFFEGEVPEEIEKDKEKYYFIRFRCRFDIKPGKLPFIHVRGDRKYRSTKCLTTSDIENNGHFYRYYKDFDGAYKKAIVTLTMTCTEWELFRDHYDIFELEFIGGCWFNTKIGIFDLYIDKYMKIKESAKGAMRTCAKLYLNNLYGKFAASVDSSFKIAELIDGVLHFTTIEESSKIPGYIAIGSAITAYARSETIRKAQANFHGKDKPGFKYADTDSLHCDMLVEDLQGVPIHESKLCHWKIESTWDKARFLRQKTYMEHILDEVTGKYHWSITCAGMPQACKDSFISALESGEMELEDFAPGLKIFGKLYPKQVEGGCLLVPSYFEILDGERVYGR